MIPGVPATCSMGLRKTAESSGRLVTETLDYDGVHRPDSARGSCVRRRRPIDLLEAAADVPPTMMVPAHRPDDETPRLREYSPAFDAARFAAHERFFVDDVRASAPPCTAVLGVSAGGQFALAMGLRHADVFGAVLCASPGAGYLPPAALPAPPPRAYFVAGTLEPFFLDKATRCADVVLAEWAGSHGDALWREHEEFPLMVAWAFGR
jgi:pimeloyl-ACP methyl ester carboxylesterase